MSRLRVFSLSLRTRKSRKQKMDSRRRGKRKNHSQEIIFEVSDDDISPEPSDNECNEPNAKILKTDGNVFNLISSDDSNLRSQEHTIDSIDTIDISKSPERDIEDDSVTIIETNVVSNSTTIDICSNSIIDITTDDSCTAIQVEEVSTHPDENIENPLEVDVIVNVDREVQTESPIKLEDFTLEEGELAEVLNKTGNETAKNQIDDVDFNKCSPCICITFKDDTIAELYKTKFLKFVQTFVELEVKSFDGLSINVERDSNLNPNEWVVLDETICLPDVKTLTMEEAPEEILVSPKSPEIRSPCKKKKKKKNKATKELFVLDTNPSADENHGRASHKYSTKFQIDSSNKTPENEGEEIRVSAQICFNCEGNHSVKDCTLPKNFGKINAARQKLRAQKQTSRYHLEEDQKYGHMMPGKISDKLREALGLQKYQLPPFIYYMRTLGYPPGWLEEAKFVNSNLEMFDTDGNNVRAITRKKLGLDPEKIVNYAGFNAPMPDDAKDEHRHYRVPPFSERFSKQAMIEFFEKQYAKEQDDFETCDMDLDASFEENKEQVVKASVKTPLLNPLLGELKEIDSSIASPSLRDLEVVKENLLAALDDNSNSNPKTTEIPEEPEKPDCEIASHAENIPDSPTDKDDNTKDEEKTLESDESFESSPPNSGVNSVKTSSFGTPILKSNSPYSRLPNPDNFMKDVSPVINFENLPNSTGKYEQMTEVLQKVRSTLRKNLQNCKS